MLGCSPLAAYVAMEPEEGSSRASWPMVQAVKRQATRASTTASGSAPPANATPAGIDAAIAAPGAMSVMLWKRTSRKPIASRLSPVSAAASLTPVSDIVASVTGRNIVAIMP
jgi:hypothetical protein